MRFSSRGIGAFVLLAIVFAAVVYAEDKFDADTAWLYMDNTRKAMNVEQSNMNVDKGCANAAKIDYEQMSGSHLTFGEANKLMNSLEPPANNAFQYGLNAQYTGEFREIDGDAYVTSGQDAYDADPPDYENATAYWYGAQSYYNEAKGYYDDAEGHFVASETAWHACSDYVDDAEISGNCLECGNPENEYPYCTCM